MNVFKIKELSQQCCALKTFLDKCTWSAADFAVGDYLLDCDTSARINCGIQEVVRVEIKKLEAEIKDAVGFSDG